MPHFLRPRRPPFARLRDHFGFILLAAMIGIGAIILQPSHDKDTVRQTSADKGEIREYRLASIKVIDGDTLHVRNDRIRLYGFDAPELSQSCRNGNGREWACGHEAKARLTELVSVGALTCVTRGRDRYGRTLAVCSAGEVDIGEAMVREGLAVATDKYWIAEIAARFARRGIWQGDFERPQNWREANRWR